MQWIRGSCTYKTKLRLVFLISNNEKLTYNNVMSSDKSNKQCPHGSSSRCSCVTKQSSFYTLKVKVQGAERTDATEPFRIRLSHWKSPGVTFRETASNNFSSSIFCCFNCNTFSISCLKEPLPSPHKPWNHWSVIDPHRSPPSPQEHHPRQRHPGERQDGGRPVVQGRGVCHLHPMRPVLAVRVNRPLPAVDRRSIHNM